MTTYGAEARPVVREHRAASGALCEDDGLGRCRLCGVELVSCEACGGRGYHRPTCSSVYFDGPFEIGARSRPGSLAVRVVLVLSIASALVYALVAFVWS